MAKQDQLLMSFSENSAICSGQTGCQTQGDTSQHSKKGQNLFSLLLVDRLDTPCH